MNIRHNLSGMMTWRYEKTNNNKQEKTLEKLASGSRINRAADDAAVLSVSQKMRARMIGYEQGEDNAADGIGFLQTGDGTMMEVASMLERMKQLTMESMNGTYTADERTLLEAEYEHLQTETDRILKNANFNGIPIFEQHESTYYSISGNRKWPYDLLHQIDNHNNELIIMVPDGEQKKRMSITVPPGVYTTQELADEIDDALDRQAPGFPGLTMEYDTDGVFHFHNEGGTMVDEITGGLSYLLYDSYGGNGYGMLLGTTQFEAGWPLLITSKNNEMKFYIEDYVGNANQMTIYIPNGNYTRDEMITYLNEQLNNNGITDVRASEYGSKCIQIGGDGYIVTGLKGNMFEIDDGTKYTSVFYDNTKYGSVHTTSGYLNGKAYYTTDPADTAHNQVQIKAGVNDTLRLKVDGGDWKTIALTAGNYKMGDIVNMINTAFTTQGIKAKATVSTTGKFESLTITSDSTGKNSKIKADDTCNAYKTLFSHTEYYQGNNIQPADGYYNTTAPSLTGAAAITFPLSIDNTSDTLNLDVDGTSYGIRLTAKTYGSMTELLTELNAQLKVSGPLSAGNEKLKAEATGAGTIRITTTADGGDIQKITFATPPGTAYRALFTGSYEVPNFEFLQSNGSPGNRPQLNFDYVMKPTNVIDSSNNKFGLHINGQYKEITIPDGTYTPEELAKIITNSFTRTEEIIPNGIGNLSAVGTETVQEGSTVPGEVTAASVVFPFGLNEATVIDGTNQVFKLKVNGNSVSITLPPGTYGRDDLIKEINTQFAAGGIEARASLDQNCIRLTTTTKGRNSSLSVSSDEGGSAMKVLAGTRKVVISAVKATISGGKMVLTGGDEGAGMSLRYYGSGNSVSVFVGTKTVIAPPDVKSRVTSRGKAYIDGVALSEPIKIDASNKELKFQYDGGNGPVSVDIMLDEKNYNFAELRAALEQKINLELAKGIPPLDGKLVVTVDKNGVRLEAADYGPDYKLSGFSGGFHDKVISGSGIISVDYVPVGYDGQQLVSPAYIVGRQNVRQRPVKVETGVNDSLLLDFSYPEGGTMKEITLALQLDAGTFQGSGLVSMIQDKLKEALRAEGLSENLVRVGLGGISTGVIGADDENSLNFSLNIDGVLNAQNGEYKIDGVRGSAAFYMFYKTEGEPIPAYITGSKDISKGVTIPAGRNDFSFKMNGKPVELLIPPGTYSSSGLLLAINKCLADQRIPLNATMKDGCLNLSFNNLGNSKITDVGGGARGLIFFQEEGRIDEDTDLILQVGPDTISDEFRVKKAMLNTCFLKINSLCITGMEYAKKSLERLDGAIRYLGIQQGSYGAYSNRLEHTIQANASAYENLMASESRMRDTDMAKEMMAQVKYSVLSQSAQAMLAQANQSGQDVLQLLR